MNFIKLGAGYINMDLVTDIWINDDHVSVFLAVPMMYTQIPFQGVTNASTTRELQFSGAEAEALIAWVDRDAEVVDITPRHYEPGQRRATQPAAQHARTPVEDQTDSLEGDTIPF